MSPVLSMCVFFSDKKQMKRLLTGGIFSIRLFSAAALESCKKMLLIFGTVVYLWRGGLGSRGDYFFPKMYCFIDQSEAVFGVFFTIVFLILFDQPSFCLSLHRHPVSPV